MLNIRARNFELTDAIRAQIEGKIEQIKEKFVQTRPENVTTQVEIEKIGSREQKGEVFRAEINMDIAGNLFRADQRDNDLYSALDKVRDELVRQIKNDKKKRENFVRRGARRLKSLLKFGREDE